jgi:hypothetical protein
LAKKKVFKKFIVGPSTGGEAIMVLQNVEPADSQVRLHIDVFSAQTGISRLGPLAKKVDVNFK